MQSRVCFALNQEAGPIPAPDRGRRRRFEKSLPLAAKRELTIGENSEKVRSFCREPEDWPLFCTMIRQNRFIGTSYFAAAASSGAGFGPQGGFFASPMTAEPLQENTLKTKENTV